MKSPFRAFHSLVLALFGTIAYKLLLISPDWAREPQYGAFVLPGVVGGLWLLFTSSRSISDKLLEVLPPVRRMFAGARHIEGDWPLVVVDVPTGEIKYYGFLTIGFKNGQYHVTGDDWHPDGTRAMKFVSMQTYLEPEDPRLHYWYKQEQAGGQQRGYTFIEFFPRDAVPERHTGVFHDKAHPDVRFFARKYKTRLGRPRPRKPELQRAIAKSFADEIAPKLPQMLARDVGMDWGE